MRPFKSLTTLQIALAVSVLAHAALLTVRFVAPERLERVFQDTPLEVILVNARSDEKPDKAQAIAQAQLAGGGDAERGRATSYLPSAAQVRLGETLDKDEQHLESMKEQQNLLLAQLRKRLAALPPVTEPQVPQNPTLNEQERKRQALIKILAEIEKRINEENARPRKRYISPSTREEVYAVYYDEFRRKTEDRGTANFPELAGRKLYGELTMVITINHDGRVLSTEVVQPSGQVMLDRRAEAIVRSMDYGRFTQAMRRRADQIVVVSRFRFTRESTLETQISTGATPGTP